MSPTKPAPRPNGPARLNTLRVKLVLLIAAFLVSVVAAFEVPHEESFVARLEPLVGELVGSPVQNLNAGVRGYGTDQTYLYYREKGRAVSQGISRHPALLQKLYHLGSAPDGADRISPLEGAATRLTDALLRRLAEQVVADTGRKLLIVGDDHNLVGFDRDALAAVADVFSYEAIFDEDRDDVAFKNDSHYSALGHERIANLLAPVLAQRLLAEPDRLRPQPSEEP